MTERAAAAIGSEVTAIQALTASGVHELLDRVAELEEREHFAITHALHQGDARRLVHQMADQLGLYLSPAVSPERKVGLERDLRLSLRRAHRALGAER